MPTKRSKRSQRSSLPHPTVNHNNNITFHPLLLGGLIEGRWICDSLFCYQTFLCGIQYLKWPECDNPRVTPSTATSAFNIQLTEIRLQVGESIKEDFQHITSWLEKVYYHYYDSKRGQRSEKAIAQPYSTITLSRSSLCKIVALGKFFTYWVSIPATRKSSLLGRALQAHVRMCMRDTLSYPRDITARFGRYPRTIVPSSI